MGIAVLVYVYVLIHEDVAPARLAAEKGGRRRLYVRCHDLMLASAIPVLQYSKRVVQHDLI